MLDFEGNFFFHISNHFTINRANNLLLKYINIGEINNHAQLTEACTLNVHLNTLSNISFKPELSKIKLFEMILFIYYVTHLKNSTEITQNLSSIVLFCL